MESKGIGDLRQYWTKYNLTRIKYVISFRKLIYHNKKISEFYSKKWQSALSNWIKKFTFALLKYFGELQLFGELQNWNFILCIFAEKIFFCQTLKEKALSTLNWFINRTFILIPGIQFELILWTRCFWTSSSLVKF